MTLRDIVLQAVAALSAHRLRATLSSIGIVFGVATVVAAFAIGEGARREAFEEIGALGTDNVFVRAVRAPAPAGPRRRPPAPALTLADARAIAAASPEVSAIAAMRSTRAQATTAGRTIDVQLVGITESWPGVVGPSLSAGRWIIDADVQTRRRVAIVGAMAARTLADGANPLGLRVRAGDAWYQIVGVLADRGASAKRAPIQRIDLDLAVLVPISTMDLSLGEGDTADRVEEIALRATGASPDDAAAVGRVSAVASALLGRRHAAADYEIVVPRELLRARLRAQRAFNAVLLGIGSLALLISGIGIMNIMLASVVERTQEIGVRRAFGARRREVVAQFATEAALLCLAGGAVGVPVGGVLAAGVALLAGWPVAISPLAVAAALLLATSVGVIFGVYPARLAASIQPIDALRAP